jgi:protein-disulfide isomerase
LSSSSAAPTINDYADIPTTRLADGGFVLGNPNAPVTIVEFSDFLCPHCLEYEPTTARFINNFVRNGLARFEYRMFPVIDPMMSGYTAALAECSDEQRAGSFWQAHDVLFSFAAAGSLTDANLTRNFASQLGLDYGTLLNCTNTANQYSVDQALGQGLGVSGTPAVMIRYGATPPTWITYNGETYNRGGVPYSVIEAVVLAAQ